MPTSLLALAPAFLLVLGGYLLGSIPTAYLASRWLKKGDLRRYGSGTVSGSMVWEHVARWAIVPVGLFDLGKAALPTWLALRWELGPGVAAAAGLAAVAGHNWPLFLRFVGGRGLGSFLGVLLVLFPWGFPWMLAFLAVGWRLGDSAPWALAGILGLPLFSRLAVGPAAGTPAIVDPLSGAMLLLTLAKRLEANRRPLPPPGAERLRVVLRRLFLDRDIASHADWIRRRPPEGSVP
jgi:glycerol-3-phosphate acyltransferase PlsY